MKVNTMLVTKDSNFLHLAVDIGGTFTDGVAALLPDGRIWVGKAPTTPSDPGEAVSSVILDVMRQVANSLGPATPMLSDVVHGTTLVANTLIERKGAKTALVTTQGMKDALDIGREMRYDLYDLELSLPQPLIPVQARFEIDERLSVDGEVVRPLRPEHLMPIARELAAKSFASVAVSLLHSYANNNHEEQVAQELRAALPGVSVSISSDLAREIKEFERTSTVAANAYVKPLMTEYLEQLEGRIDRIEQRVPLHVMVSSGGFTSARTAAESPILLLESGPAAGVLAALNIGGANGIDRVLAFDMGGTTAKVCVAVGPEPPVTHSFECAREHRFKRGSGLPILIPSIDLIEIGAGGGSIAHVNRLGLLNVGPESVGSVPGPACYALGGTHATVTDADLLLGYLNRENFLGGKMLLHADLASRALSTLANNLGLRTTEVARGIYDMVNENMAAAARIHIAEKGFDPRSFTMVTTGGAGPVHAVEVARRLHIPRVLASIAAGAGSCLGMLAAPARVDRAWSNPRVLADTDWEEVARTFEGLRRESDAELQFTGSYAIEWWIGADMRYYGQGENLRVTIPYREIGPSTAETIHAAFEDRYRKLYGRLVPGAQPQVITWRLTGLERTTSHRFTWSHDRKNAKSLLRGTRPIYLPFKGAYAEVQVFDRYSLPPGTTLEGPVILEERESTLVVPLESDVTILPDLTVSVNLEKFE
jgi:N-methylhydantoinase A